MQALPDDADRSHLYTRKEVSRSTLRTPGRCAILDRMNTDVIHSGDCLTILPTIPEVMVDLAFLDPPFNIGLAYPDYDDRRPEAEYLSWIEDVLRAVLRVLCPMGSIWVQIGQSVQAEVAVMLKRLGLHWRNTVAWHYTFGPHQSHKYTPSWQALHWFTMHPKCFTFNADAVREPSLRQTKYRDKRANPTGRIPGDVWTVRRVFGTSHEKIKGHSCQTPLSVLDRIIRACSNPGELVLDPMCGTGTACVAAAMLGRRFVGIELSETTALSARRRIEEARPGSRAFSCALASARAARQTSGRFSAG